MFNHNLTAFVSAIDSGSFTKAADKLFVTPTAVMKQINSLESHLGLKLIERTSQGVRLTPAGEVIYRDAKFLFDFSKRSIENAKQAANIHDKTFRVGTSLLYPAKAFMDLWYKVSSQFPDYKLHLVPFEDNHEGILSEIEQLGKKFDFEGSVIKPIEKAFREYGGIRKPYFRIYKVFHEEPLSIDISLGGG